MGKNLNFCIGKDKFSAGIIKIDRAKVYGFVEEQVLDLNGNLCMAGNLMEDGQTLVLSGAAAMKTVTENNAEVNKKNLKTVYMDGKDAVLVPSSYDHDIILQKAGLDELFNLEVITVYQLTWAEPVAKKAMLNELEGGVVYRFVFNYRADYEGADAILLGSQNEIFVLTGRLIDFEFLEKKTDVAVIDLEDTIEQEEEMDFGML